MGSKRAVHPMLYLHIVIEPVKSIHVDFRSIMSWICIFMTWNNKAMATGSKRAVHPMLYLHIVIEPVKSIHVDFRSIMSWICSFMTWKNKACAVQP